MSRFRLFCSVLAPMLAFGVSACAVPPPGEPFAPGPTLVQAGGPSVGERLQSDLGRIEDGAHQGQFTTPEYNELRGRYAAIERTRQEQLAQFGGRIPPGLYAQLEQREEALSRTIFAYRHNGATPTAH